MWWLILTVNLIPWKQILGPVMLVKVGRYILTVDGTTPQAEDVTVKKKMNWVLAC